MHCACSIFYCRLCPVRLYSIFQIILPTAIIAEKKFFLLKMCFLFLCNYEKFLIITRIVPDIIIKVYRSSSKVPIILVMFQWNIHFLERFWNKYSNIRFHENSSDGSRVVPCGKTDGQRDMTKLVVAFRNFVTTPKIYILTDAATCRDIFVKRVKVMKGTVNSLNIQWPQCHNVHL
jgi:hypothetical protein